MRTAAGAAGLIVVAMAAGCQSTGSSSSGGGSTGYSCVTRYNQGEVTADFSGSPNGAPVVSEVSFYDNGQLIGQAHNGNLQIDHFNPARGTNKYAADVVFANGGGVHCGNAG